LTLSAGLDFVKRERVSIGAKPVNDGLHHVVGIWPALVGKWSALHGVHVAQPVHDDEDLHGSSADAPCGMGLPTVLGHVMQELGGAGWVGQLSPPVRSVREEVAEQLKR
jgi:hypothetical protein